MHVHGCKKDDIFRQRRLNHRGVGEEFMVKMPCPSSPIQRLYVCCLFRFAAFFVYSSAWRRLKLDTQLSLSFSSIFPLEPTPSVGPIELGCKKFSKTILLSSAQVSALLGWGSCIVTIPNRHHSPLPPIATTTTHHPPTLGVPKKPYLHYIAMLSLDPA